MNKNIGVWIDHRKAIIVTVKDRGEETKQILSNLEKKVRRPSEHARSTDAGPEDRQDRAFMGRLNRYYDKVIACIGDVPSVLILGPAEAKQELKKRLVDKSSVGCTIVLETKDRMTDRQVALTVRRHFVR